jgi:hypothetical protein
MATYGTYYMDGELFDQSQLVSDAWSAVWKALTTYGLANVTVGQMIQVYGMTFTVTGIQPKVQIIVQDPRGVGLSIPNYNWSSAAQ